MQWRFSDKNIFFKFPHTNSKAKICNGGISMKATGIVRRIDDLGRVVVPKEIEEL